MQQERGLSSHHSLSPFLEYTQELQFLTCHVTLTFHLQLGSRSGDSRPERYSGLWPCSKGPLTPEEASPQLSPLGGVMTGCSTLDTLSTLVLLS